MEAHVHVVLPQDAIADAGRHGRGESVEAAAASGPCAVVWERHGRAEELGEFLRRALVHALHRHGEVERIEDALRDLELAYPTLSARAADEPEALILILAYSRAQSLMPQ